MSYYQGDFYKYGAGYYQGDPGFFGFLGGLAKSAVGLIPGVGPAVSRVLGGIGGKAAAPAAAGRAMQIIKKGATAMGGAIVKHPVLSAAGAAGAVGALGGAAVTSLLHPGGGVMPGAVGARGWHMSKPRGGHCPSAPHPVRNRHMNPCNPRALRRAIRRATRFTRLAMKTIHLVHPKKKGRFGGFRKHRKRAA